MAIDIGELVLPAEPRRADERYGPKPDRLPPLRIQDYTPIPPQHNPSRELPVQAPDMMPWPEFPPIPEPKRDMGDATPYDINTYGTRDAGSITVIKDRIPYHRNREERDL